MRAPRSFLLACWCLMTVQHALAAQGSGSAMPLFAFSNAHILTSGKGSLQVMGDFYQTLRGVITGAAQLPSANAPSLLLDHEGLAAATPDVIMVVLGDQVETSDLRKEGAAELFQPLQALLSQATSSVSMPFLTHNGQYSLASIVSELTHKYPDHVKSIGCGSGASTQSLPQLLTEQQGEALVLLVCPAVEAAADGTAQGIAAELHVLKDMHSAVEATGKKHLTLFAGRPTRQTDRASQQQRRLLATSSQAETYTECDALCQVHVQWLQGMLAILLLAVAALSGLCCLNMLDVPTRFEVPKEAGQRTD